MAAPISKLGKAIQMASGESRLSSAAQKCCCHCGHNREGNRCEEEVSWQGCRQRLGFLQWSLEVGAGAICNLYSVMVKEDLCIPSRSPFQPMDFLD